MTERGGGDGVEEPFAPRFYGRRIGRRLRPLRSKLMATLLPRLCLSLPPGTTPLDLPSLFARPVSAVWLEVGFGAGEHLIAQARANPAIGLIGCEPFMNGIATLLADVDRQPVDNLRLFVDDARLLLPHLPDASIARLFLLFPDPWPKTRHHRRRFIGPDTVALLARIVADDGELRVATDQEDYARWSLAHVTSPDGGAGCFTTTARSSEDWHTPPADWLPTRYQRKTEAAGARPIFLSFRRQRRGEAAAVPRKDLV